MFSKMEILNSRRYIKIISSKRLLAKEQFRISKRKIHLMMKKTSKLLSTTELTAIS